MPDIDARFAALMLRQHGVITVDDVLLLGGNHDHIRSRVNAGRWERVHQGVYRLAGLPWTYEARVYAALRAAGSRALASHLCAARLQGLGFAGAPVELTVPRGHFHRPEGLIVHTSTDLHLCRTVSRNGIAMTDPARTVLDAARRLRAASLTKLINDGERRNIVSRHDLVETLAAHARKGRPGVTKLRKAVAEALVNDGFTETESEQMALVLFREHGFPEPTLQYEIHDGGRFVASMDFAFIPTKVNIEIDGPVHDEPEVRAKDDDRDFELRERFGWIVRRIPHTIPMHQPRRFVAIVRSTLAAANSRLLV